MRPETRFRLKAQVRRANRLRWYRKWRNLRDYGALPRMGRGEIARYVLLDPEVGDFSFTVTNLDAVARFVAGLARVPEPQARAALEEARTDAVLRGDLEAHSRPDLLHRSPEIGPRVIWYALARLLRPAVVVETGTWYGMGACVLLRALERNAEEGEPGRLISFDPDPTAGWLVPRRHADRWRLVCARTEQALEPELEGLEVGLFVHDSSTDHTRERFEHGVVAGRVAPGGVLLSGEGTNTHALSELAAAWGVPCEACETVGSGWYRPPLTTAVRLDAPRSHTTRP